MQLATDSASNCGKCGGRASLTVRFRKNYPFGKKAQPRLVPARVDFVCKRTECTFVKKGVKRIEDVVIYREPGVRKAEAKK